jgi:hypothetical protein
MNFPRGVEISVTADGVQGLGNSRMQQFPATARGQITACVMSKSSGLPQDCEVLS